MSGKTNYFLIFLLAILILLPAKAIAYGLKGYVDGTRLNSDGSVDIWGWACDDGDERALSVHIYLGAEAGKGKLYKGIIANRANEAVVNEVCHTSNTSHRYLATLPASDVAKYTGQFVYIHGISQHGPNRLLKNSGRYAIPRPLSANSETADCTTSQKASLLNSVSASGVITNCNLTLNPTDRIIPRLHIRGLEGNGVVYDCRGATLENGISIEASTTLNPYTNTYDYPSPSNVTIKNCTINKQVIVNGMASNPNYFNNVIESSRQLWHVERVQFYAPKNIVFNNVTFGGAQTKLYVHIGTTNLSVRNSRFIGTSEHAVIYLDAETAFNTIENNVFDTTSRLREVIAVDGSAHNVIKNNVFNRIAKGAVHTYRNCGERGLIRHQTPDHNLIEGNTFNNSSPANTWAVWLASRNGNRNYCEDDSGYAFGSSADNRDLSRHNIVQYNYFQNYVSIKVDETPNTVHGNGLIN
ncbi:hypothetical protein [Rheinheimera hassiensis]|uniref:hypothetical protein n=1 Tax=Rheinheimera hassiensis TaxID=1193627 RepID=UPI001F057E3F|nr:hypothetical protein [Rheinheimera hassiensis]